MEEVSNAEDVADGVRVRAGAGIVELAGICGKTVVTRMRAGSPLKILSPRSFDGSGRVITSTYGGGLVDGDRIRLQVHAGAGTRSLIGTQASTKVYRGELGSTQELAVRCGDEAVVVSAPDPVVCYAGAKFSQVQGFDLSADSGLVMVDWFTSGRWACGERWAMSRYASRTEIRIGNRLVFRDAMLLDPADGAIGGEMRMGRCDCYATVVVAGPKLAAEAKQVMEFVAAQPAAHVNDSLMFSASGFGDGVVVRAAGVSAEIVGRWIRERLVFVCSQIGEEIFARRF